MNGTGFLGLLSGLAEPFRAGLLTIWRWRVSLRFVVHFAGLFCFVCGFEGLGAVCAGLSLSAIGGAVLRFPTPGALSQAVRGGCVCCGSSVLPAKFVQC